MDYKQVGTFLANMRKEKGLTQNNLADILNVTHQAVSRWEQGESIPDIQSLINLAAFYNITVDEIIHAELTQKETVPVLVQQTDLLLRVKKMNIISASVEIAAFILFFCLTWITFYEDIGFAVQWVLTIGAVVLFLFGYHDLKADLNKHKSNGEYYINGLRYMKRMTVNQITLVVFSLLLTIPYLIFDDPYYAKSILLFSTYLKLVWLFILCGLLIALISAIIINNYYQNKWGIKSVFSRNKTKTIDWVKIIKKVKQFLFQWFISFIKIKRYIYVYLPLIMIISVLPIDLMTRYILLMLIILLLLTVEDIYIIIKSKALLIPRVGRVLFSFSLLLIVIENANLYFFSMYIYIILYFLNGSILLVSIIRYLIKLKAYTDTEKLSFGFQLLSFIIYIIFITLAISGIEWNGDAAGNNYIVFNHLPLSIVALNLLVFFDFLFKAKYLNHKNKL